MIEITAYDLGDIMPYAPRAKVALYHPLLIAAMERFEIDTAQRAAPFLANVAHESGSLRYVREIASGEAYEGRADLGNTEPGDGKRFPGRGLIQITGRRNYYLCGVALGVDLVSDPVLLETPKLASKSAAWFWAEGAGQNLSRRALAHGIREGCNLNELADIDDFEGITLAINGGTNGLRDRIAYWERAKAVLA